MSFSGLLHNSLLRTLIFQVFSFRGEQVEYVIIFWEDYSLADRKQILFLLMDVGKAVGKFDRWGSNMLEPIFLTILYEEGQEFILKVLLESIKRVPIFPQPLLFLSDTLLKEALLVGPIIASDGFKLLFTSLDSLS